MYSIGFLLVILICLSIIGYIVISKFPQLRNLNVETLPQEKEYRKKKEIIEKRLNDQGEQIKKKIAIYLEPARKKVWGQLQLKFRIYVGKIQRLMHHEEELDKKDSGIIEEPIVENKKIKTKKETITRDRALDFEEQKKDDKIEEVKNETALESATPSEIEAASEIELVIAEEPSKKVLELVRTAEQFFSARKFDKAEEKFIAAIKLDQKNISAYRGLADTYFAKGAIEEARETYKFVLQLDPEDDSVMVKLAEIAESQGDLEEAVEFLEKAITVNDSFAPRFYHMARLLNKVNQPEVARDAVSQAVELDPENSEYLDLLLETAIILRDRDLADVVYNRLRSVEPGNKKLPLYKEKITIMY